MFFFKFKILKKSVKKKKFCHNSEKNLFRKKKWTVVAYINKKIWIYIKFSKACYRAEYFGMLNNSGYENQKQKLVKLKPKLKQVISMFQN